MENTTKEPQFIKFAEFLANAQADELETKRPLPLPRDQYVKGKTITFTKILHEDYKNLLLHMEKLNELLLIELQTLPQVKRAQHRQELILATNRLRSDMNPEELTLAGSWQSLLKLSNETLLWIYQVGYKYFEEKKFIEALHTFLTLVMLNPFVCDYLIALGSTQQSLFLETPALHSFSLASILEPEHATLRCRCAEIYLHLGQFDDALLELEALKEIIQKQKLDSLKPHFELLERKAQNKQPT